MGKIKPEYGIFSNGIPYARFGEGKKNLLAWFGGPGNDLPKGFTFKIFRKGLEPFEEDYTIHLMTRKSGLPENYTTKDMAADYAELIKLEFSSKVDLIIGVSFGGMIAQHFAADYPDLFDHIVIAMAAHKISEEGKELDYKFAELRSKGKNAAAYALITNALFPRGFKRSIFKVLLWLIGGVGGSSKSETFSKDIMIEAAAELAHDSKESLARIKVPVLILCGDKDFYFPIEYMKETAKLIPKSTLKVYPNKGHGAIEDKQLAKDVLDFIKGK